MISHEDLVAIFDYIPETGDLIWKIKTNKRIVVGTRAGTVNAQGYVVIRIKGVRYRAHRLIWFYNYKSWPINHIDHINGRRDDNRLHNLRDVTPAENIQHQTKAQKRNKTKFLGVSHKKHGFIARICTNGIIKHLGSFKTPEEAHEAYILTKRRLHAKNTL
jgi:hypothetical protein